METQEWERMVGSLVSIMRDILVVFYKNFTNGNIIF